MSDFRQIENAVDSIYSKTDSKCLLGARRGSNVYDISILGHECSFFTLENGTFTKNILQSTSVDREAWDSFMCQGSQNI